MDTKLLLEKRNSLVEKMENMMNTIKVENRVFTDEENKEFDNIENEINEIDNVIAKNEKLNKLGLKSIPQTTKAVDNDVVRFENMIRGIVNADEPTTKDGGKTTIPTSIAQKIIEQVVEICPIYSMAERYNVKGKLVLTLEDKTTSTLKMTYADEGSKADSGKVAFKTIELDGYLARALAKVSKSLINNSQFDIVNYVINKISQAVAEFIEHELLIGTDSKVEGLKGVTLKVETAVATKITSDELIDVQALVKDAFQKEAIWIMNTETRTAIRKLKDGDGNYLLNRDFSSEWGYTLLGKPVYTTDTMDKIAQGKTVIYYGDMSGLAVKVNEEATIQVLREKYAEEHMDGFLTFVEMDAKVQNTQKIAKLVCKGA